MLSQVRRPTAYVAAAVVAVVLVSLAVVLVLRPSGSDTPAADSTVAAAPSSSPTSDQPSASSSPSKDPEPGKPAAGTRAVGLKGEATSAPGVTARLKEIDSVQAKASLPGEVGGPALAITVSVKNQTDKKLNLALGVVNAYFGPERTPAVSVASDGEVPFPPSVAPGDAAEGVYVFQIPEQARPVRVELDLGDGADVVVFKGRPQR
ncbi:hypothetical protein FB381_3877 [Nocardioides albertanoniae]|uniref:DUF4352 domain-containing protein n=1 Tax=Nocardioides albertanoniae TaxID=1175486 RepID=A0A543ABI0_9ACTN|nr:hypothetical protein [Nocardioides albertanoniae]TQL69954.1 hypothetical protein FB381_3877 [Nocardioides albertanoniae]